MTMMTVISSGVPTGCWWAGLGSGGGVRPRSETSKTIFM